MSKLIAPTLRILVKLTGAAALVAGLLLTMDLFLGPPRQFSASGSHRGTVGSTAGQGLLITTQAGGERSGSRRGLAALAGLLFSPAEAPGDPIQVAIGTLPAGKSVTIRLRATVKDPLPVGVQQVSNQGRVMAGGGFELLTDDPVTAAAGDPTVTQVDTQTDLAITQSVSPAALSFGESLSYTLTFTNTGLNTATGVVLTDTLPASLTVTDIAVTGVVMTNTEQTPALVWAVQNLAPGESGAMTIIGWVNSADPASFDNIAVISTASGDPVPENNYSSAGVSVSPAETVTTITSDTPDPSITGESILVQFQVDANNPFGGAPTGEVVVSSGATSCTAPVAAGECHLALPASGSHNLTAAYQGDGKNFQPSTSAQVAHLVLPAGTTTELTSSANPSVFGQGVTFVADVRVNSPGSGTPTGGITFYADGTAITGCQNRPLSGGSATCTINTLEIDSTTITAAYSGDVNYIASTSAALIQEVRPADTTTSLAATSSTSVWSEPVTFTATVQVSAPGAGMPTGEVVFRNGATELGKAALDASGSASFTTNTLAVGSHSITAEYTGSDHFLASVSAAAGHTVDRAGTIITLVPPAAPSVWGQPITFSANVAAQLPAMDTPDGALAFLLGGTAIPGCENLPLVGGAASCTLNSPAAGSLTVTAEYTGTDRFEASSASVAHQVDQAGTTTSLESGRNPSTLGETVTLTATVQVSAPGAGIPTGTVTFYDDKSILGSTALKANGQAIFSTASLELGNHDLRAEYSGDANAAPSSSEVLQQTVNPAKPTVTLTASPNPSVWGQAITLTVSVEAPFPAAGAPTGSVAFLSGSTVLGVQTLDASGQASLSTAALEVGSHDLTVTYSGDARFLEGASDPAVVQVVNRAGISISLTGPASPTVWGETATFTATVQAAAPGAGLPTGEVIFQDGSTELGRAALDAGGTAVFSINAIPVGRNEITAQYSGDTHFEPGAESTALEHIVNRAGTSTVFSTSGSPTVWGEEVTLTARVSPAAPGAGAPSGEVTFWDGETALGAASLDASGVAVFSTAWLAPGSHTLTAAYAGDGNFLSSESLPETHTVDRAESRAALEATVDPAVYGQPVTLNASVTALPPGAGTPSGEVTFLDGATELGRAALDAEGKAALAAPVLDIGSHNLTVVYAGDQNFLGSASPAYELAVHKAETSTNLIASGSPSTFGETVTFTATVAVLPPGAGTPSGEVIFLDGATELGAARLDAEGQAVISINSLTSGEHTITARYFGDNRFNGSVSAGLAHIVGSRIDLALTKTAAEPGFLAGSTQVYRLTVANAGPSTATQVVVTDNLPANLAFVAASAGCEANRALVTCRVDALPAGAEASFTLTVTVGLDASGVVINTAQASAAEVDSQPANNTASVTTTVSPTTVAYEDDFDQPPGDEWSRPITATSPSGETFLGEFGNERVTLRLGDLPAHNRVTVSFRLFILRSWDGNQSEIPPGAEQTVVLQTTGGIGPDEWSFQADGRTLLHTTFSNWDRMGFTQAYPGPYPGGDYPARTGSEEGVNLGYSFNGAPFMDSVYNLTYTFDHTADTLELAFAARGLQSIDDESWGLEDVQVRLSGDPMLGLNRVYIPLAVK